MEAEEGCRWIVLVDAAAYHNRNFAAMMAEVTDEEIERYGMPEPWFPESPGEVHMEVPCGGEIVAGSRWGMCADHNEAMDMDGRQFEAALASGVTWSNDHTPYN